MVYILTSLESFFVDKVRHIPCEEDTKAYIVSTFVGFKKCEPDHNLYGKSITLEYNKAQLEHSFELYQQVGDWILFTKSMYPESLTASEEYYDSIAQLSYYKCYRIVNKQWQLYKELATKFPIVVKYLRDEMRDVSK
jgi:hypothetical protein